jgi:hypothetical protein
MRFHLAVLLATVVSLIAGAPASAQWSDFKKWEITPFVGFETAASYPVSNSFTVDRLRADSGVSFGAFVAYSLTENSQVELMWARNNTSFSAHDFTTNSYSKAFNSDIDQVEVGFLYMLRNSEKKLRPFIDAGIGFSHESNDSGEPNHTLLMFGLGGRREIRAQPPLLSPRRSSLAAFSRQQDARSHLRWLRQLLPANSVQLSTAREPHGRDRLPILSALTRSAARPSDRRA